MNSRWLVFASLLAFASPGAASADDVAAPPAAPSHGGRILDFGDGRTRAEVVHDASLGTFTVYGLPSAQAPGAAVPVSGSMCGGRMASRAANVPVLVLRDGGTSRTVHAIQVAGDRGVWRFDDPALRNANVDASLRIAGRDGPLEASFGAAAVVPEGTAAPREGWAERRGPMFLSTASGRFETVHDGEAGTITVVARTPANAMLELERAPTLALRLPSGEKSLTLERVEGRAGTWRVQAEELKGALPLGTLRVDVDGRREEAQLISSGDALPTPASAEAPPAADPMREGPVPARLRSSGVVVLADGMVRLKVTPSPTGDSLTLEPLSSRDARALGTATPEIVLSGSEGERALRATALADRSEGWTVNDPAILSARGEMRVRVTIEGKTHEAPLVLSNDAAVGLHGGAIASFGDGAATLEVVRDVENGTLMLYVPGASSESAVSIKDLPEVSVNTADGTKTLTVEAVSDVPGAWRVTAPELKAKDLSGTLKIRLDGRNLEAPIPASRTDLPKPEEPKPTDEIGAMPRPQDRPPQTDAK
jgi:hypothetical protein